MSDYSNFGGKKYSGHSFSQQKRRDRQRRIEQYDMSYEISMVKIQNELAEAERKKQKKQERFNQKLLLL